MDPLAIDPTVNFSEFSKVAMSDLGGHHYAALAALGIMGLVALAHKYGAKKFPFLATDAGNAVSMLLLGSAGAIALTLSAGSAISLPVILAGLKLGFTAAGGFATLKKLVPYIMSKLGINQGLAHTIEAEATAVGTAAVNAAPADELGIVNFIKDANK